MYPINYAYYGYIPLTPTNNIGHYDGVPVIKKCKNCGVHGHFSYECPTQGPSLGPFPTIITNRTIKNCAYCGVDGHFSNECAYKNRPYCVKCESYGHYAYDCNLDKYCEKCKRYGHSMYQCIPAHKPYCSKCDNLGHTADQCNIVLYCNKCNNYGHLTHQCKKTNGYCENCDQYGHWTNECKCRTKFVFKQCYKCGSNKHESHECPRNYVNIEPETYGYPINYVDMTDPESKSTPSSQFVKQTKPSAYGYCGGCGFAITNKDDRYCPNCAYKRF